MTVAVDDCATLADLVGIAELAAALDVPMSGNAPVPAVVLLFARRGKADRYRPFLAPPFPVTFCWEPREDGALLGTCWYDESAVTPVIAAQLARHVDRLVKLLGRMPADLAGTAVGDVELVDAEETAALLAAGQPHPAPTATPCAVHEAFGRIAAEGRARDSDSAASGSLRGRPSSPRSPQPCCPARRQSSSHNR